MPTKQIEAGANPQTRGNDYMGDNHPDAWRAQKTDDLQKCRQGDSTDKGLSGFVEFCGLKIWDWKIKFFRIRIRTVQFQDSAF